MTKIPTDEHNERSNERIDRRDVRICAHVDTSHPALKMDDDSRQPSAAGIPITSLLVQAGVNRELTGANRN